MIRFIVLAFNVAAVAFLIYSLLEVIRQPLSKQKKDVIIMAGIILLIFPDLPCCSIAFYLFDQN
jgi:hypothetical protein